MDYVIAIPSYKRATTLCSKTLQTLRKYDIDKNLIYVFVVPEEYDEYREKIESEITVIPGVLGLVQQRKFITDFFPSGTNVVYIDDDVEDLLSLGPLNLHETILRGFRLAKEYKCRLWGIYPVANKFFMSLNHSTNLKYIVGAFYGLINTDTLPEYEFSPKEDWFRTCAYFKTDGKVVRLNDVAVKTKYYKEPGGLQETRTISTNLEATHRLCDIFPELITIWTRPRTGMAEVRPRRSKKSASE